MFWQLIYIVHTVHMYIRSRACICICAHIHTSTCVSKHSPTHSCIHTRTHPQPHAHAWCTCTPSTSAFHIHAHAHAHAQHTPTYTCAHGAHTLGHLPVPKPAPIYHFAFNWMKMKTIVSPLYLNFWKKINLSFENFKFKQYGLKINIRPTLTRLFLSLIFHKFETRAWPS